MLSLSHNSCIVDQINWNWVQCSRLLLSDVNYVLRHRKETGTYCFSYCISLFQPNPTTFSIKATDKGTPSQSSDNVSIEITITDNDDLSPPKWSTTSPQFSVNETVPQDFLVGSLTATSQIAGSTGVTFTAIADGNAGSQVPPFYIKQDDNNPNQVNIYILNRLNYEETKSYSFQLRARVSIRD